MSLASSADNMVTPVCRRNSKPDVKPHPHLLSLQLDNWSIKIGKAVRTTLLDPHATPRTDRRLFVEPLFVLHLLHGSSGESFEVLFAVTGFEERTGGVIGFEREVGKDERGEGGERTGEVDAVPN
jgi:hypothetical protein